MRIAREGYPFIAIPFVIGIILVALYPLMASLPVLIVGLAALLLGAGSMGFFRNPRRAAPDDETVLVSPADGKVLQVLEIDDEYVGAAYRVDIFLSIFDVHINRIPSHGIVEFVDYRSGRFFSAFKEKASDQNERNDIGIVGRWGKLRVAQIAGSVARRIVCHVRERDKVAMGQICGMIRLGSRTELTFPRNYAPSVRPGQHVRGGETIVGKLNENA